MATKLVEAIYIRRRKLYNTKCSSPLTACFAVAMSCSQTDRDEYLDKRIDYDAHYRKSSDPRYTSINPRTWRLDLSVVSDQNDMLSMRDLGFDVSHFS